MMSNNKLKGRFKTPAECFGSGKNAPEMITDLMIEIILMRMWSFFITKFSPKTLEVKHGYHVSSVS